MPHDNQVNIYGLILNYDLFYFQNSLIVKSFIKCIGLCKNI